MLKFLLLFFIITLALCASGRPSAFPGMPASLSFPGNAAADTLLLPIRENQDNAIREDLPPSALFLKKPANVKDTVVYDPISRRYVVMSVVGGKYQYSRPYSVTLEEYLQSRSKLTMYDYNRRQTKEGNKYDFKNLISEIQFLDKILSPIFGKDRVKLSVQGSVELTLGVKTNKVDNPTLPVDLRKTTTLDFDEKIQFGINGNIGDLINLDWTYNTDARFDFDNMLKLNYEGKEDDIVKKVEAGNVSLPLPGTLITGGQNLWGFRTDLQFGKLSVSGIFSQQKGESKVVKLEKGAQKQEFEISALDYEVNKHFFLSKYFRDQYDAALRNLPVVNSGVTITKIEVWVTNKSSRFDKARNIAAFVDLGENRNHISNPLFSPTSGNYPNNDANTLYGYIKNGKYQGIRDINSVSSTLAELTSGRDYEKLENARLLDPSEYMLNEKLGYISLNSSLNAAEVLAVAYEYTVRGEVFTVGELTSNAPAAPATLAVKMLKSTTQSPALPTWDLMMKNVYNIGAFNLSNEDFVLDILYQNDRAGTKVNYVPAGDIDNKILLSVLNLDRLNSQMDAKPDGKFDYIEGITVYSNKGRIVFPVLEPFGAYLAEKINNAGIAQQYVYDDLYTKTQSEAEQNSEKNKFFLKGSYKSSTSSEISLGGGDISQGSVKVLAGGVELTENIDFMVDYTMGTVQIINQALLEAGTPITIKSEDRSSFGMQTKTLVGTHLDYKFNDKLNIGATVMHMNEKPLTHKVNIGEEPLSNTIWGFNATYNTESGFLTTLVDKLPFINTKVKSRLTIDTEFAKFQPGTAKGVGGNAYIDDFEGSKISIDMKAVTQWKLASTPQDHDFPEGSLTNDLAYGYNRAKLAWYVVDPLFYRMSTSTPSHIRDDKEQRSNHFVREIRQTEIFPNKDLALGDVNIIPALTVAFYPEEKGPYNFRADGLDRNGKVKNPGQMWGGMMRSIQTNDFEAANVQYIEMWLMDPFVYNSQHRGGDVYFDLGDVSEDILKDGRKSFENGLPTGTDTSRIESTIWGRIPLVQSIVNGFDNNSQSRRFQDVGLDGMNNEEERVHYAAYLENLRTLYGEDSKIYQDAYNDPAGDDYHYFRGSDFDALQTPVLDRYKRYNGTEGNSPTADMSPESYSTAATTLPDVEDINGDNTLNETEAFFRYHLHLTPNEMQVGKNFISSINTATVELPNGTSEEVKWYQIRIPLNSAQRTQWGQPDLKSIRFMRMFLKGFQDSIVLRMASLDLVRDNWRKYEGALDERLPDNDPNTVFDVSVVNLEENASKTPVNYVMPPGIERVVDATNPQMRELNEQAMALKTVNLREGYGRAVYKNMNLDVLRYKTLRMDVHAEALADSPLEDRDLTLFLRFGSDNTNNYYEYEMPLVLTPPGFYASDEIGREGVWPTANRIELPLRLLQLLKQKRNTEDRELSDVYELMLKDLDETADAAVMDHIIRVKGKPSLGAIRNMMIGIRNPESGGAKGYRSAEVWVNELRLSDFDNKGGWAANARMTMKLADVATISFAGSRQTQGFGSLEQHASEIAREDLRSIDFSTNVEFGKFFPEKWRLRLPMYYAYSRQSILPEYDPLDTDIPLEVALDNAKDKRLKDSIRHNAEDYMMRKSLNFTNIGVESKTGESRFFDLANLSLTFSYNKSYGRNVNTERDLDKNYRGLVSYIYTGAPPIVQPFKNSKSLDSKYLRILKDFNFYYMPSMLSVTSDITRNYREMKLKNLDNPDLLIEPTVDKDFTWRREYAFRFNLTENLLVNFRAEAKARIDEPEGIVDKQRDPERYQQWKDTVWHNILDGGRPVNYNHNFSVEYKLPIDKLPFLDWTSTRASYGAVYDWQAGAITADSVNLGNVIRNSNALQVNSDLMLTSLYNKSKFLRDMTRPFRPKKGKSVKFETGLEEVKRGRSVTVKHKLKTGDIQAKLTAPDGKQVKMGYKSVGRNKIRLTPSQSLEGARLEVTGRETTRLSPLMRAGRFLTGLVTGIKSISVGYSEDKGTTLPGFLPEARWLGQQGYNGSSAPGFKFLFGGQRDDFGIEAARKGWITTDSALNSPYLMNASRSVYVRLIYEPVKKFRVELTSNWIRSRNSNEYLIYEGGSFSSMNKVVSGNFSMTTVGLKSAFYKVGNNTEASLATYQQFLDNRKVVSAEMAQKRYGEGYKDFAILDGEKPTGFYEGYGATSQEVLISAFNRAYGAGDYEGLIPKLWAMRPNWKVTYNGLTDFDLVKKLFKTVAFTHTYNCKYNVGSYASNLQFQADGDGFSNILDAQNNWMSLYDVSTVSINEQFNPLIGVNLIWQNNLTTNFSINRRRDVSLSLVNAQLSETSGNEIVVGAGYRFGNLPIFTKHKKLDNDVNLQCDFSIRRNNTVIRRISESVDQLTAGQEVMSVKVSADYTFNNRLNLRLFYDRVVNTPYVSLSFPTTNTNFGVAVRYTLTQ